MQVCAHVCSGACAKICMHREKMLTLECLHHQFLSTLDKVFSLSLKLAVSARLAVLWDPGVRLFLGPHYWSYVCCHLRPLCGWSASEFKSSCFSYWALSPPPPGDFPHKTVSPGQKTHRYFSKDLLVISDMMAYLESWFCHNRSVWLDTGISVWCRARLKLSSTWSQQKKLRKTLLEKPGRSPSPWPSPSEYDWAVMENLGQGQGLCSPWGF